MNPASNPFHVLDELEQTIERAKGFMGKRFVDEEWFFTKMQQLRAALPIAAQHADDGATIQQVLAHARSLSRADRLRLIAQLSAELAPDET